MWPVEEWLERARVAWPDSELAAAGRAGAHGQDVALACGCAVGDPTAIQAFEATFVPTMRAVLARMKLSPDSLDEVLQSVREKLLASRPPRITRYAGAGALNAWVRAVAVREALTSFRRSPRHVALDDELLDSMTVDPELQLLKARYRCEFKAAFQEAMAGLSAQDRNILRQSVLDELRVDQLAALHGVHRVTMSRWLGRIRALLLQSTRAGLAVRLQIPAAELDSVILLIRSQLEISLERVLE